MRAPSARVLVGRTEELEALAHGLASSPAVAIVAGEAGIGKTRLVSELPDRAELAHLRFVVGACRRIRDPFPLGPVLEAVRELADDIRRARLSPVAGALRPLLPEVADLLPAQPAPLGDRVAERHRVFRAIVDVLGAVGPVVVVLEDLHWADEQTIDLLSYLLADPPSTVSLVLTFRDDETHAHIRALTARLPAGVTSIEIGLASLDDDQTGALAAGILGVGRVPDEFASRLRERASGVPFAIEQMLALLADQGMLGGDQRLSGRMLEELEVPRAIRDFVLERVSRLPEEVRAALEAGAVLQHAAPESLVAAVSGRPIAQVREGLARAIESGLLADSGTATAFRHVLAAQAVYDSIPGPRRRQLHDRAADALAAHVPCPLGRLAHHLEQAGRMTEWLSTAERAADQAVALGHDDEAVRLLGRVLRHVGLEPNAQWDPARRGRLAVKLAVATSGAVRGGEVLDLVWDVLRLDLPVPIRGELRFRAAVLLDRVGGDVEVRSRLLREAVTELDHRPGLRAWAMLSLGVPRSTGASIAEHVTWIGRSLDVLPDLQDPLTEVFILGKAAMVLASVGDPRWRRLRDQMMAKTGTPDHPREVAAYGSLALAACYSGRHATAEALLVPARAAASRVESPLRRLVLLSTQALLDYCTGSWEGLADRLGPLLDELDGQPAYRVDVEAAASCLALARGDLDAAAGRLDRLVRRLEEMGGIELLPLSAAALIRLALARGDAAGAGAATDRLLAALPRNGPWVPAVRAIPAMTQALVATGRLNDAEAIVNRFAGELADVDAPLAEPVLRHARGLLNVAGRRGRPAAAHLLAAADGYEALRAPYEAAQAREEAATALFAVDDPTAEVTLQASLTAYDLLGATWDRDRAARTARRHGVSPPSRHRGGSRGYGRNLSPREHEVAELAATGLTNKEIAQALFITADTVNKHLRAAMRKHEVRSRAALAARITLPYSGNGEHPLGTRH